MQKKVIRKIEGAFWLPSSGRVILPFPGSNPATGLLQIASCTYGILAAVALTERLKQTRFFATNPTL